MRNNIKRIEIKEFRKQGYLQEVNRQFFHPIGLALEIIKNDDGSEKLGGIWDYRDDLEGISFAEGMIDQCKIENIKKQFDEKAKKRQELLGYVIQSPD